MFTFEDLGIPLTEQKIVPGNTITSIAQDVWLYRRWKLNVDDVDAQIYVGDWLVGNGGAVAKVVEVSISAWTNGSGYVILDSWNGTAYIDNENVGVAAAVATQANVDGVLVSLDYTGYPLKGKMAKAALVTVYDATSTHGCLIGISGGKPDQTLKSGIPMMAGSSIGLRNIEAIKNFKCVDYTASDASVVNIICYF
jgi:hypothetical protein